MTMIQADRESMGEVLKKPRILAEDVLDARDKFPGGGDAGAATEEIASIVEFISEAARMSVAAAVGLTAVATAALDDVMRTEEDIVESLKRFAADWTA